MKESAFLNQLLSRFKINRNSEWIIFFWCILIASVYWFMKAMNKRYTSTVDMRVEYVNVPEDRTFTQALPEMLNLRVNAQGWDLFAYSLKRQVASYNLDIGNAGNTPYVVPMNNSDEIVGHLSSDVEILTVSPDTIPVMMESLEQKTVPVLLLTDSIFPKQYGLSEEISVEPDSVVVSGPKSVVQEVEHVATKKISLQNLTRSTTRQVELEKFQEANIKYSTDQVQVYLPVEKLTEGKVEVPIDIINLAPEDSVSLIPQRTTITFQTALSNYSNIYPGRFQVTVDAAAIDNSSRTQLKISVATKPPFTYNLRLKPEYVDYIRQTK
ncbi:MAG: CdaR family protein [Bacteroidia bacterium]